MNDANETCSGAMFEFEGFEFRVEERERIYCHLLEYEYEAINLLAEQVRGLADLLEDHVDFNPDAGAMTALHGLRQKSRAIARVLADCHHREHRPGPTNNCIPLR